MKPNRTEQRGRLMAALSAAEQITAASTAVPEDLSILSPLHAGAPYELNVRFRHTRPEDVAELGAALGLAVSLEEEHRGQKRPYVEARGVAFGLEVRAWAWGDPDELEAYRDAVALVAMPVAAWHAAVAS